MPEQHGKYSRHAEEQGKGEKIPLLTEKVYVWISKKFHAVVKPLFSRLNPGFSLRSLRYPGDLWGQKPLPQSAQRNRKENPTSDA
jgi:hypothetical protein